MWSYIQGVPVPDQCGAIYREYQYQINVELYTGSTSAEVRDIRGRYVHEGRVK
jgi:hypothetical protein